MINKKLVRPALLSIIIYLVSYSLPKFLVNENNAHFIKVALDDRIPLVKPFILVYFMAFIQWTLFIYVLCKQEDDYGYKYTSAIIYGSIIGAIIFIFFPTGIYRTTISGDSPFNWIYQLTFFFDSPYNALPSFHCFCSWGCYRGLEEAKNINKGWVVFNLLFSFLVFASTLLTKQHYIVDVPAGIILFEFAKLIANKYQITKYLFEKSDKY